MKKNATDVYTIFEDSLSGGFRKNHFHKLAVKLPKGKAVSWFRDKYGRSPYIKTCCCREAGRMCVCDGDYLVYTVENLEGEDIDFRAIEEFD